jgi:ZIP family zinc transporter
MMGATLGLAAEGMSRSAWRAALGVGIGAAFVALSSNLLKTRPELHLGALRGADARRALLVVGAMTFHSFSEGVGVGVAFGDGRTLGLLIALAIAVHNVPKGLAISLVLVLVPRGVSVRGAAGWSVFSSLPQPLMAVPAFLFVESFSGALPLGLGFAAAAMVAFQLAVL